MTFSQEISFGDLLTSVSVLIAFSGLVFAYSQEHARKSKEYADKIRNSASLLAVKIERINKLGLSFYDQIQPYFVDADSYMVEGKVTVEIRDDLWKKLVDNYYMLRSKILEEEIELAYANLYGYDQTIRELYSKTIYLIEKEIDDSFRSLLQETQKCILKYRVPGELFGKSAELGNQLRKASRNNRLSLGKSLAKYENLFRNEILLLQQATDNEIAFKKVKLQIPNELNILSNFEDHFLELPSTEAIKNQSLKDSFECSSCQ